jgi:hypothetical protein
MLGLTKNDIILILHRANMEFWKSDMPYICANPTCCDPGRGDRKMYHINPDKRNTSANLVRKFYSLEEIYEYAEPVAEKKRKWWKKWGVTI